MIHGEWLDPIRDLRQIERESAEWDRREAEAMRLEDIRYEAQEVEQAMRGAQDELVDDRDEYRRPTLNIRRVCAWCGMILDGLGEIVGTPLGKPIISHGICPECAAAERAKMVR